METVPVRINGALPEMNTVPHATVLIVGNPGVGKRALATALDAACAGMALNFRLAEKLPLPDRPDRPKIDFIILMLDLSSRASWDTLTSSITAIEAAFFVGRCTIIVTNLDKPQLAAVTQAEVDDLAVDYDVHPIYSNLNSEADRSILCGRLRRTIRIAAGYSDLTPAGVGAMVLELAQNTMAS